MTKKSIFWAFVLLMLINLNPVVFAAPADTWKTGQTSTSPINPAPTGSDGALQKGVTPPTPRFTDNGNGTVTDNLTGLIWLKNANCPNAKRNWTTALSDVASLNTTGSMNGNNCGDTSNGGAYQTDWRLPNRKELLSLIDFSRFNPALPNGHPFTNLHSGWYWSSSSYAFNTDVAWVVDMHDGYVNAVIKTNNDYVLPVRGGQSGLFYNLIISKAGAGSGTISATGCTLSWVGNTGTCSATPGTSITISGVADSGSTWSGWSGGTVSASACSGIGNCTFNLNADSGATGTFALAAVNGACGSSNGGSFIDAPTTNLCTAGTATAVTDSGATWTWSCNGENGGTTASCLATDLDPVNGVCGSSNGQLFASAPFNNLCATGNASAVTGTGPWNWTCGGANGGIDANCFANVQTQQDDPTPPPPPEDNDNIPPTIENNAPNGGDGNGDGVKDSAQQNVTSFVSSDGNSYVTLQTGSGTQITNITTYTKTGFANTGGGSDGNGSASDSGYDYPLDIFEFEVTVPTGSATQIRIYFENRSQLSNYVYRKFSAATNTWTTVPGVTFGTETIGGKQVAFVSFSITDGGPYDDDGVANGVIKDPGGPAIKETKLTVKKTGTGSGDISTSSCNLTWTGNTGTCIANAETLITLIANAGSGSSWLGWSDGTNSATGCGGNKCVFTLRSDSELTGSFSASGGSNPAPTSTINKVIFCDIDNNRKQEIVKLLSDGVISYLNNSRWTAIPGTVTKDIACGDLNGDGKTDMAGINTDGTVLYTLNSGANWQNITGGLSVIGIADINGDGKADIYGSNNENKVYVSYNLSAWTELPGYLDAINHGDFNSSRTGNEVAGLTGTGYVYYTSNLSDWTNIPGLLSKIITGDINGDGVCDVMGINDNDHIYYTTNLSSWTNIPGLLKQIASADLNGDGKKDIIGLNSSNNIYYTTDLSTWNPVSGALTSLIAGDINGDGKADVAGI